MHVERQKQRTVPVGFRFHPSEEELVFYYLRSQIEGEPLLPGVVQELDLYGDKNPWDLFDKNKTEHVFTKLKKKSRAKLTGRSAKPCPNGKNPLWFKKDFIFEVNKRSA
ncbi:NAC transcription factor 29-like [Hevea brasiliensis]|uniref:NAC transcription factor 29-like n=1 Tax=Hevea brasiliensis TaxID=3981 RepID=UPI0025E39A91|nr:NAC transcription factor 29-like [Hevea brasiliensis]